jgi:hypothetical protein
MNYTTVCEVADVCRAFYNVQNLSNFSTNVVLATCISWPEQILPINFLNYKNTCMYKTIGLYIQEKKNIKY